MSAWPAVVAALIVLVVVNLFAQKADGLLLSPGQGLVVALVSGGVALQQVRRVVRPLR